ncbi:glycoside hydrolase domain-containing protein [Streptomyces sp. Adlamb9]|uniref:glycoside hydrolase domain-containing protein n=1 Tax=Streptomyces sp. Adlamb9 TaxID=3400629 RepID=UPI003F1AF2AD
MDQMVLKAQQWVNATYKGVSGYNPCTENGDTGWETIYCLTRALQHELGITALSDSFGPTTWADLSAYGPVGRDSGNVNMRTIAEAALYCKGYSGGDIDGGFNVDTGSGLTAMVADMGLPGPQQPDLQIYNVEPKVFKALLTMDAYVLTAGGSSTIQTCQRWLNDAYYQKGQFFIGPCDGHFSRNVQQALVLAIQYQMGLTDSQVTGSIGPTTEGALKSVAYVSSGSQDPGSAGWVRLFQCAVAFNGYDNHWGDGGGTFTSDLAFTVTRFQQFCSLDATGAADYETWMSLLVSTGDPERKGTAFDCMYPLNATTIQTVKDNGYAIVGRYLTGGTNKVLTNSEIALIFDNGLSLFPIYQEEGNTLGDFGNPQGVGAGNDAAEAAITFGIPYGTVIYFSVDFDATDDDITSVIIPHFQGIRDGIGAMGSQYAIGAYGCRNTCLRLEAEGLITRSFVSGMSTGYSGNLGYPLPDNWAFDQIKDFTLADGTSGAVEIDNDIASGRDPGVNSVTRPRDPNDAFYTYLIWVEARAGQWIDQGHTGRSAPELVAQYLRARDGMYTFTGADTTFGSLDSDFVDFVNGYPDEPFAGPLRDPDLLWDNDVAHFGASFGAVITSGLVGDLDTANLADFGSWGGDLVSVLGQFHQSGLSDDQAYDFASDRIAGKGDNTNFSLGDFLADIDAWVLGNITRQGSSQPLSTGFKANYASPAASAARRKAFYTLRFGGSTDTLASAVVNAMIGGDSDVEMVGIRTAFWYKNFGSLTCPSPEVMSSDAVTGVGRAFRDAIVQYCS